MSTLISWGNTLATIAYNPIDSLMGLIGGIIISITSLVLYLASTVFELILNATVIGFGATLKEYGILDGIELVWSAFRDISNIVIIGMFVFVAIATILGNVNYGVKRFLVRILTVAILINFSLLFTQLVVDVSNLAANQFYKGVRAASMNSQSVFQETNLGAGDQAIDTFFTKQGGVAGAFMNKMGISSFFDTAGLVASVADSQTSWLRSIGLAMFFTFVVVVLIIATATVFLYGAYLMIARGLLLIFLLATSSLAFAAWLVPKYGEGKYGWDGWLTTLIQNAVFAPMLMIMLWASLVILSKAPTGSLGAFIQHPDATNPQEAMATLVVYLFTLGMLYLSLKVSSSFSKKITGFNLITTALNATGRLSGDAFGFASRRALRWTGAASSETQTKAQKWVNRAQMESGGDFSTKISRALAGMAGKALLKAPDASLNPARVPAALSESYEKIAKRYGFGTQGKGGIRAEDSRAEEAEKKALEESMKRVSKTSEEQKAKIFKDALTQERERGSVGLAKQTEAIREQTVQKERYQQQLISAIEKEKTTPLGPELSKATAARKELERKVNETAENIENAATEARKAAELMLDTAENRKQIEDAGMDPTKVTFRTSQQVEEAALKQAEKDVREFAAKAKEEVVTARYPGDENKYKRYEILQLAQSKREAQRIKQAIKDIEKEAGEDEKKKPSTDEKK